MKILLVFLGKFVEPSGGMERVCCEFANHMVEVGYQVTILYYSPRDGRSFYPLLPKVEFINLMSRVKKKPNNKRMPLWMKCIREIVRIFSKETIKSWNQKWEARFFQDGIEAFFEDEKPQIIISFDLKSTSFLVLGMRKKKIPLITMLHFNPDEIFDGITSFEKKGLTESSLVQVLTPSFKEKVKEISPKSEVICIPNMVPSYIETANLSCHKDTYKIINVARLCMKQKRQHLLVEAFSKLTKEFPNWILELWGEEQDRDDYTKTLKKQISDYNLQSTVFLKGTKKDVLPLYLESDIFCFPSAYEGFGLALTEAMSAGLPVVAFKSCPPMEEIVLDGITGLLADDGVDALAEKLRILMLNQEKRIELGKNAHLAMQQYSPEKVWQKWESVIQEQTK